MVALWTGIVGLAMGLFAGTLITPRRRGLRLLDDTARFRSLRAEGRR